MYNASETFINLINAKERTVRGYVTVNNGAPITDDGDLISVEIESAVQTSTKLIGNVISKKATIKLRGTSYDLNGPIVIYLGVGTEYIPTCNLFVDGAPTVDEVDKTTTFSCYDKLQIFDVKFSEKFGDTNGVYTDGMKLSEYAEAFVNYFGFQIVNNVTYGVDDIVLVSHPILSGDEICRNILGQIAELYCANVIVNRDNKIEFVTVVKTQSTIPLINGDNAFSMKREDQTSAVNVVSLVRDPQGDIIYQPEELPPSITELKISNNVFVDLFNDAQRKAVALQIYNRIGGFQYYPFESKWRDNLYTDVGDVVKITDCQTNPETEYTTLLLYDKKMFDGGLVATSGANKVDTANSPLERGTIKDALRRTELIVNKLENYIEAIVSKTGGMNLIKNSAFYRDYENWEKSDPITVSIENTTALEKETDCGSMLTLNNGELEQTIILIKDQYYTLSFQYKKDYSVAGHYSYVYIYNPTIYEVFKADTAQNDWKSISYTFIAGETNSIKFVSDSDNFYISDLRIVKGEASQEWSPYKDEVYGKGVLLDSTGMEIRSLAGEDTTAKTDNDSFTVYDGETLKAELSDERIYAQSAKIDGDITLGGIKITHLSTNRIIIGGV